MDDNINIQIKYLSAIRDKVGHGEDYASFPRNSKLLNVKHWLNERYSLSLPNPEVIVTLNGKGWNQMPLKLSTGIKQGDVICIFPIISGG